MNMINRFAKLQVFLLLSILLSGCATIIHGPYQSVGISSHPANASIWVDRQFVGNTPLIVDLTRKDSHFVRIELDDYQPYEVAFTRKLSGWVIVGGMIGLVVDATSGSLYKLTPDQIQVQMQPIRE